MYTMFKLPFQDTGRKLEREQIKKIAEKQNAETQP